MVKKTRTTSSNIRARRVAKALTRKRAKRPMPIPRGVNASPATKQLLDPCNAKLTYGPSAGSSADGYLIRNNRRQAFHVNPLNVVGYVAWFPDFHCVGSASPFGANGFVWETTSSSNQPLNTASVPFGSGAATTTQTIQDVSSQWVTSGSVSAARTVAACLRFFTTAAVSTVTGQLALCTGITPDQLLNGGTGGGPMSVSDLFNAGQTIERMPLDVLELRHAPSTNSSIYRDEGSATVTDGGNCFNVQPPLSTPTTVGTTASGSAGIVIAWSSLNNTLSSDMLFEFVKIIEWLPAPVAGVANIQDVQRPKSTWENICDSLSDFAPGWQHGVWKFANGVLQEYGPSVAAGVIGMNAGAGLMGAMRAGFRAMRV